MDKDLYLILFEPWPELARVSELGPANGQRISRIECVSRFKISSIDHPDHWTDLIIAGSISVRWIRIPQIIRT